MENMAVLKKIHFFRDLSPHELTLINMITKRAVFGKDEEVVREGAACESFFVIREGSVRISAEGKDISTVGKERPIGEVSFIDKGLRSATTNLSEETVLIEIPSTEFGQLLSREHALAAKIYRAIAEVLCTRLRETNDVVSLMLN